MVLLNIKIVKMGYICHVNKFIIDTNAYFFAFLSEKKIVNIAKLNFSKLQYEIFSSQPK